MLSEEQQADLLARVRTGNESVRDILESMSIDPEAGLRWLQGNMRAQMKEAKAEQVANRGA